MGNIAFLAAAALSSPLYWLTRSPAVRPIVDYESARWAKLLGRAERSDLAPHLRFGWLVATLPEFRSLVHYRIRSSNLLARLVARAIWRGKPTLEIHCDDIGPGLFIQHGFATTITANKIGRDCWINQQVTIGHTRRGRPTIGDRVSIGAAAIVVGPISIGDDAQIGVNAVVIRNVTPGSTMVAPEAIPLLRRVPPTP
jgi:serine O-acetyltransferase